VPRRSVMGTVALGRRCSVESHCHSPRGGFNGVSSAKKGWIAAGGSGLFGGSGGRGGSDVPRNKRPAGVQDDDS
jgi:hypothetical protein